MVVGRIHSVETFGAVDGPGIRYVVFFQGCRLRCLYCHNPDSWDLEGGTKTTSDEVLNDITKYTNFIKKGGVTLSGGEPLMQPEFALDIIRQCKELGLHTALDTAGSVVLDISKPVIDEVDMLLLDIKTYDEKLSPDLTGRETTWQLTLETLNYCEKIGKRVWIRHVIVQGYTLDKGRLEKLADFLTNYKCVERIDLLPFHKMGEYKWEELGEYYRLLDTPTPQKSEVDEAYQIFKERGLNVHV